MRRFLAWVAGLAGGAALWRAFRRERQPLPAAEPDPAAELKARLAEARAADDRDEAEAGETTVDAAPDPPPDVESRRRSVHEQARAALDEMGSE